MKQLCQNMDQGMMFTGNGSSVTELIFNKLLCIKLLYFFPKWHEELWKSSVLLAIWVYLLARRTNFLYLLIYFHIFDIAALIFFVTKNK